jgi:hypothetical protein
VAVQVEDRVWNASYGLDTPWLTRRVGGVPNVERAGYHLRIDTSGWSPGPHYVTVAAFDLEGGRSAIEGSVYVRPLEKSGDVNDDVTGPSDNEVTICLDRPLIPGGICEVSGPPSVSGWAHAESGIEAVVVTLDHRVQHEALRPIARPELLDRHGPEIAAEAGFALRLHASECPPGRHTLEVAALARDGRAAGFECELICHDTSAPLDGVRRADGSARTLEDRMLLAEVDAAASRAETDLARRQRESTVRALRDTERALQAARAECEDLRRRSWTAEEELAEAGSSLATLREELERRSEAVKRLERSLSWRLTRPLRWLKRRWLSAASRAPRR